MSAILKAVLSHYLAQKDRIMFDLETCMNKSAGGIGESALDKVIRLFKELSDTERVIDTVKLNIDYNNKKSVAGAVDLMKKIESAIAPEHTETKK